MKSTTAVQRLAAGDTLYTLGIRNARTADIARMAVAAGYPVMWIDLEHSSMPIDCATHIAAVAHDLGAECWVRVPEREFGVIGRLLDGGATGIIVPRVETPAEARCVVNAARFPPQGQRSQIAQLPQFHFARMPALELNRDSNRATTVQVLIESQLGVDNAAAIAAVDGVDILGVGLNDLSADLGCLGDFQDVRIRRACRQIGEAAGKHGKVAVAGGVPDARFYGELFQSGFSRLIFSAIDTELLTSGLALRLKDWQRRLGEAEGSTPA